MRRALLIALLAALLLTGCSIEPNISVTTGRHSADICTHNGYLVKGYEITGHEDGSFTVSVTVRREAET